MSYNFAIVIPPIPENDDEAWAAADSLTEVEGVAPPIFRALHDQLTARYPCLCSLPDDDVDDGVWSDGPLWDNFGERAAVLGISYSRVAEVLPFVIQTATGLGLSVFDWGTERIHRGDGFHGLTLNVEDRALLYSPTIRQFEAAIDQLTPDGGPGFLVLEGRGQDYVQAAGGDGQYTAEWREYSGSEFRHWVAGSSSKPAGEMIEIPTNGFHVTVHENESLAATDVKLIFQAFARQQERPVKFHWRDKTRDFV